MESYQKIFAAAGLTVVKQDDQVDFPKKLFPVTMWATVGKTWLTMTLWKEERSGEGREALLIQVLGLGKMREGKGQLVNAVITGNRTDPNITVTMTECSLVANFSCSYSITWGLKQSLQGHFYQTVFIPKPSLHTIINFPPCKQWNYATSNLDVLPNWIIKHHDCIIMHDADTYMPYELSHRFALRPL